MISKIIIALLLGVILKIVSSIETTREAEGHPNGYLTDCPGVTKPAIISKASLRRLLFIHLQGSHFLTATKKHYNYYQMKQLARNMDFRNKTLLYMNGYMDSSFTLPTSKAMGGMYSRRGYNVLLLEYLEFTATVYPIAVRLLRPVGQRTAEMLAVLTDLGLDPKKLELLGISHGGQGISFIAKSYRQITGKNISRITGLDPSGPCQRRLGPKYRIDASDADFVDIIHTNTEGYGMAGAVGHVDFYVNGGEYQTADLEVLPCTSICSHMRSYTLWVSALENQDSFIALQCDSIQDARDKKCFDRPLVTNLLGPKTDVNKPGIFYLATRNYYPYYLGEEGIKNVADFQTRYVANLSIDDVLVV